MKAITIRQPWAWAIVHGGKDVENRTRNIAGAYRGPVAIHAGLADAVTDHDIDESALSVLWAWRRWWAETGMPGGQRGHVIGVVDLVDVHADCIEDVDGYGYTPTCSPWAMSGHHHLALANPRPLATLIPVRGALGLWTLPADVEAAVLEQVTL